MAKSKYDLLARLAEIQGVTGLPSMKIQRAAETGGLDLMTATPADVYRAVTGMELPGPAREYAPPAAAPMQADAPMSLEDRVSRDPGIRGTIEENAAGMPAELLARARAGDSDAIMEAYRMPDRPVRQMELPMGDNQSTAMVPYGQRGPGVPGDMSGPGVLQPRETGMIPAPLRGIPGEGQRRLGSRQGVPGDLTGPGVMVRGSRGLSTDVRLPRLTDENSFGASAQRWADNMQDPSGVRSPPPGASAGWQRLANSPAGRIAGGVGIAGAGIGAIDLMMPNENGDPPVRGSSTADLAEESRPIPSVESTPDEAPAMPRSAPSVPEAPAPEMPADYSFQARELMNKLNAMRRQAGGEVPEAPQMMAEINRLLGMSNKQRNAPGYQPAMPTDHHGQAQMLLQKLNAMRMEAGGEVPEAQQIMAEVRRHQAMGDQMRNAR